MIKNKKGDFIAGFMGFLFIAQIIIVIFMFLGFGLHFLLYDYGISPAADVSIQTLNISGDLNSSSTSVVLINNAKNDYLAQSGVYDILIFVMMIITFIQSCIVAVKSRKLGFWSFYGYLTIGFMILAILISFSLQIRDWILNEIFYKVITETFSARLTLWFINYPYVWGSIWFITLLVLSYVDLTALAEKTGLIDFDGENGGGRIQE